MLRQIYRNMAKERLKAMGVRKVNKVMSNGGPKLTHTKEQNYKRTEQGRAKLAILLKEKVPLWKRVIFGDLRAKAEAAFNKANGVGKAWR